MFVMMMVMMTIFTQPYTTVALNCHNIIKVIQGGSPNEQTQTMQKKFQEKGDNVQIILDSVRMLQML